MRKITIGGIAILLLFCPMLAWAEEPQNSVTIPPPPPPQYTIKIVSPAPEETYQNDAQSITVTVAITPDLEPEDTVVLLVDGAEVTEPQHSTSINLPWLERGSHTVQAKIIQPKGNGALSDVVTFYQQRVSLLLPPTTTLPLKSPK